MLAALGSSRAQQQRLVMDASHELRTPLTALRTNIELLQRASTLDDAQRVELVDAAQVELAELSDLVAELVDLATDARAEEPVQPVDLGDVVERVVERERRRSGRDITFSRDRGRSRRRPRRRPSTAPSHNLSSNACKFSPDGTPIEVEVTGGTFEVRDRGVGIAPDELEFVFDRFYRATAARSQPGSGLGLSIVQQIARDARRNGGAPRDARRRDDRARDAAAVGARRRRVGRFRSPCATGGSPRCRGGRSARAPRRPTRRERARAG